MFLSSASFTIIVSSIWPYLRTMDDHASKSFYGWIVASFSLGQLVSSPIFGFWANYRPLKEPMFLSLTIFTVSSLVYSYCDAFPADIAAWVMMASRFFVGVGAGNVSVVRAYISAATTEKERTSAMANVSAFQALGIILGPVFGLAFAPLGYPGLSIPAIKFAINLYTGPGYLGVFLGIVNIILLFFFKEIRLFDKNNKSFGINSTAVHAAPVHSVLSKKENTFPSYDKLGSIICIFLFFSIFILFTVFETIGTPLSMDEFAWTRKEANIYNNIVYAALGITAIIVFIIIKVLNRYVQERTLFVAGLMIISIALFLFIPLPGPTPVVKYEPIYPNGSSPSPDFLQNVTEAVGCDFFEQEWCEYVPQLRLWQFLLGSVLMGVGFANAQVMCYAIFSKMLGPFPQGTMMGFLTAAGSLARSLGPVFVSYVYTHTGPQITFGILDGYVGFMIILSVVSYKRLVPYKYTQKIVILSDA